MNLLTSIKSRVTPAAIEFPFEEVKEWVKESAKEYEGLTFDEETIKQAKETLKDLNAAINSVDDKRKELKKQAEKPIKDFEKQMKEILSIIQDVKKPIQLQVEEATQKLLDEKTAKVKEHIKTMLEGRSEEFYKLPLPHFTLSTSFKSIYEDFQQSIDNLEADLLAEKNRREVIKTVVEMVNISTGANLLPDAYYSHSGEIGELTEVIKSHALIQMQDDEEPEEHKEEQVESAADELDKLFGESELTFENPVWHELKVLCTYDEYLDLVDYLDNNGIKFRGETE